MRVHRLQNPFEHWLSGLAAEIGAIAAFLVVLAALSVAIVFVATRLQ